MMRQEEINVVNVVMKVIVERKRGRGRPKKRWFDTIENDMKGC
jgi:hypothetical protein